MGNKENIPTKILSITWTWATGTNPQSKCDLATGIMASQRPGVVGDTFQMVVKGKKWRLCI